MEHPVILTVQYNSVFMIDNLSIRIVINVESLVKYAKVLMLIFAAFNFHVNLLHAKPAKPVSEAKEFVKEAVDILEKNIEECSNFLQSPTRLPRTTRHAIKQNCTVCQTATATIRKASTTGSYLQSSIISVH